MATKPRPPQQPIDFSTIITESKRIIRTHPRHFLALSLIFLLPISISPFIIPKNSTLLLLISFFSNIFYLLAIGSITYSVYRAFYERPISLIQSIKSSLSSFFPLLFTFFLGQILAISIFLVAGVLFLLLFLVFQTQIYSPNYSITPIVVVVSGIFFVVLVYFQINYYALALMVVVVESKWGVDAYRRSHHLMKGMKKLGLSLLLYYGFFTGLFVWFIIEWRRGDKSWTNWEYVIFIVVVITCGLMMVSLSNTVSFTVLYIHCKEVHGGEGSDEEENDGKEPLLASAV